MSVPQANSTWITDSPMPEELRTACTPVAPLAPTPAGSVTSVSTSSGRQARGLGHNRDARPVQVGKNVDRQVVQDEPAVDQHDQGDGDRQQPVPQGRGMMR